MSDDKKRAEAPPKEPSPIEAAIEQATALLHGSVAGYDPREEYFDEGVKAVIALLRSL